MKSLALVICWSLSILALLYLAIGADHAALVGRPVAAAGFGLIGVGLCIDARRRIAPRRAPASA